MFLQAEQRKSGNGKKEQGHCVICISITTKKTSFTEQLKDFISLKTPHTLTGKCQKQVQIDAFIPLSGIKRIFQAIQT